MERYKRKFEESTFKGNFIFQKFAIKDSFKNIKIIEQIQNFFEKSFKGEDVYATLTPGYDKNNTIVSWNIYFKINNANLNKIMEQQIVGDVLSISSKLSIMSSTNNSFQFNLEI